MSKKVYKRKRSVFQVYVKSVFADYSTWTIIAATIGTLVGTITAFIKKNDFAPLAVIALISSVAILLIKSILNITSHVRDTNAYFFLKDDDDYKTKLIKTIKDSLTPNYKVIGNEEAGYLFYDEKVNNWIANNEIALNVTKKRYQIPKDLRPLLPFVLKQKLKGKRVFTDDKKVCLNTDLELGVKDVNISLTRYFDGEVTSELSSKRIRSKRDLEFKFNGLDLIYDFDLNKVKSLANNSLSNRIGGTTLAITNDNYAILLIQGHANMQNPGKYIPSGSGSMDFADTKGCKTLQEFLIKGIERELNEESSAGFAIKETKLIGYGRIIERGTVPEFFGVTYLTCSKDELQEQFDIKNKERKIGFVDDLIFVPLNELDEFIEKNKADISLQLLIYKEML